MGYLRFGGPGIGPNHSLNSFDNCLNNFYNLGKRSVFCDNKYDYKSEPEFVCLSRRRRCVGRYL